MQHEQRTRNSATNRALGQRAPAVPACEADASDLAAATKSAARLAAEAAFAAPQGPAFPQPPAQIIVRRTRSASLSVKQAPEAGDGATSELAAKGPRVFRVEAPPMSRSDEASLAALPPPTAAVMHNGSRPARTPENSTARRIATDKRPGPVLHVIHAPPERTRKAEAPQPRLALLIGELERVTPVLEVIARAQAFSLVDERIEREWLRLSLKVDEVHAQIQAHVRSPLRSGEPWK